MYVCCSACITYNSVACMSVALRNLLPLQYTYICLSYSQGKLSFKFYAGILVKNRSESKLKTIHTEPLNNVKVYILINIYICKYNILCLSLWRLSYMLSFFLYFVCGAINDWQEKIQRSKTTSLVYNWMVKWDSNEEWRSNEEAHNKTWLVDTRGLLKSDYEIRENARVRYNILDSEDKKPVTYIKLSSVISLVVFFLSGTQKTVWLLDPFKIHWTGKEWLWRWCCYCFL